MIAESEVVWYLSGGAGNTSPAASLGGARSSTIISDRAFSGLFGDVSAAQRLAGIVRYRCFYVRVETANPYGLLAPVRAWIAEQPSGDDAIAVGLDSAGKNGTATTIPDETTAPAGVSFSAPASDEAGIELPDAPYLSGDYHAIWVRDSVPADAQFTAGDGPLLCLSFDHL